MGPFLGHPHGVEFPSKRQLVDGLRRFLRINWRRALRIRERLRITEETFHLLLAGGVGVIGGLVNVLAFYAVESVKVLFLHSTRDPVEIAEVMGGWQRVALPTLGGLCAGLVLYWGLRLAGPQRSSNILEVVVAGDGRLPFRSALVKFFSSMLSIGSGSSIGREGSITQLTATFASKLGQLAKWHPYRLRLLVGCGAASGISAAYNAPISGAVFAALIVLGNFSMSLFAPLVFASVVATMVSRSFFGIRPWYEVPPFEFTRLAQLPWFVVLGFVAGIAAAVFLKLLARSEDLFGRLRAPIFLRLALGGLIVGLLAIYVPEVWGNGYVITNRILHGELPREFESHSGSITAVVGVLSLGGLFLAKLVATLATVGSGAVGGVFTPTLFLGAALGAAFGLTLQQLGGGAGLPIPPFAMVGMGSMLAATTRSPLLAMIMVFEISLEYSLMPALMLACVVATLVSRRLHADSIYTEPLLRKGVSMAEELGHVELEEQKTVADVMLAPVTPVRETATIRDLADRFLTGANNFLPVIDAKQRMVGIVALQDLKEYLGAEEDVLGVIAYDVMRPPPPCVTPNQRLMDVLPLVISSELRNIPVVNTFKENRLIGALERSEVLAIVSEAIATRPKSGK